MAKQGDEQLVQQIADQVLALIRQQQRAAGEPGKAQPAASTPKPTHTTPAATFRPVAGVCTGDYSKFVELQEQSTESQPQQPKPETPTATADVEKVESALTGIVTAQQLQDAIAASTDGVATLAQDAKLTPLANDLARQHPEKIRRGTQAKTQAPNTNNGAAGELSWLWWADGHCPQVQKLTGEMRSALRPSVAARNETGLVQVLQDLSAGLRQHRFAGGVLFVESATLAMCYANRAASLRAVLGTCEQAVAQGIEQLGANVLVIEYPYTKPDAMAAMVKRFVQSQPKTAAHVQRHLAELHRNG